MNITRVWTKQETPDLPDNHRLSWINTGYVVRYTMKARLIGTDDAHRIPEFDTLIQHVDQMLEERRNRDEAKNA